MKCPFSVLLLALIAVKAQAQQPNNVTPNNVAPPAVPTLTLATPPDGFPPLPAFDLKDNYDALELNVVKDWIKYGGVFQERTTAPLRLDQIAPYPTLGSAALEVLSQEPLRGTFVLSSNQAAPSMRGIVNLSLKRFNNSLDSQQMFYRHIDTNINANSPSFSPDGRSILLRNGIALDRYDSYGIYLWQLNEGRLRYLRISLKYPHVFWSPGSRYVSFIQGGDAFAGDDPDDPQRLCVLDTVTRGSRSVMESPGLDWSWTYDGHLLCAYVPGKAVRSENSRPSVYRVPAQGGEPKKLFDGGYHAHQSPDGQNIAFCDWAGDLMEDEKASPKLKNNALNGLFFWNAKTDIRTFLGALPVEAMAVPRGAPQMVWSSDNKRVFVLMPGNLGPQVVGRMYVADVVAKTCRAIGQVAFTPGKGMGWFEPRLRLTSDEKHLYFEARETVEGLEGRTDLRYTLWQMDTDTGKGEALARLTNRSNENPDWDFRDDSGLNPALVEAQKRENADTRVILPAVLSK